LQAVISAAQAGAKASQLFIPTPETNVSLGVQYERLYPEHYQQPATYIRFSSTVEDCVGCPYCMTAADELFLKQLNAKHRKGPQCSEDQFEQVMNFFEQTSSLKQPFASVDNTPLLSYEELAIAFDEEEIEESAQKFAKDIYPHWKASRSSAQNHLLMPTLKFERNADTDDSDPYVCFRRREVRQARKTRGRDAQIIEKLRKLRRELEDARNLMHHVKNREFARREQLSLEKRIFDHRASVKEVKRHLQIKGDDEDLINQKPIPKARPKLDPAIIQRGAMGAGMIPKAPLTMRPDGRPLDSDLVQLADERQRKNADIQNIIQDSMNKHRLWNNDWVDDTWRPITPPLDNESRRGNSFRAAFTESLPTPPPSLSEEDSNMIDGARTPNPQQEKQTVKLPIRYADPAVETGHGMTLRPAYRRRTARAGRMFIDRRGLKRNCPDDFEDAPLSPAPSVREERERERFQYDIESDEEAEVYYTDPYDDWNIKYRIAIQTSPNRTNHEQVVAHQRMLEEQQKRLQQGSAMAGANNARAAIPVVGR
jgi:enhancer of polycomb-like protein